MSTYREIVAKGRRGEICKKNAVVTYKAVAKRRLYQWGLSASLTDTGLAYV